ncbi:hypothetical protein SJ05684_c11130 [Sinorhizobium sojae CCBAU 05684]|uniref:NB-ARC domain-containing protein n=2 Tax=Sinorhizobium sojae TaxID=716925 RepID=A0A249PBB4_9HYPH|nr:hypothetical protein SJ05684_c11130 [Sinorhizobium sojae CCBAU 05684]
MSISGIGGSGKSDTAAAFTNHADAYRTVIWIHGHDLKDMTELSSMLLKRAGAEINVAGLLKDYRGLLVIDDLPPTIALGQATLASRP